MIAAGAGSPRRGAKDESSQLPTTLVWATGHLCTLASASALAKASCLACAWKLCRATPQLPWRRWRSPTARARLSTRWPTQLLCSATRRLAWMWGVSRCPNQVLQTCPHACLHVHHFSEGLLCVLWVMEPPRPAPNLCCSVSSRTCWPPAGCASGWRCWVERGLALRRGTSGSCFSRVSAPCRVANGVPGVTK